MTSIQDRLNPNTTVKISYDGVSGLDSPRFILAYWSIRGLGAPLRMMLSAAQCNHWVIMYDSVEMQGSATEWDKSVYLNDKTWLRDEFDSFMNMPFLVDCQQQRVIAQTNAIFTYLGRELSMLGVNPMQQSRCEELLCEVMDLRNQMVRFAYQAGPLDSLQHDAQALASNATFILDKFEHHLSRRASHDPPLLVGLHLTAPDFHLWEMLDQFDGLCRTFDLPLLVAQDTRPHLDAFKNQMEKQKQNAPYFNSFLANQIPFNNCSARFGSNLDMTQFKRGQDANWRNKGVVLDIRDRIDP